MHRAVIKFPTHNALTLAVLGHDQIDGEILNIKFSVVFERLTVERVQDRVTGAVGGGTGALHGGAFAELGCVTAKGTLINLAFFGARKRNAVVL